MADNISATNSLDELPVYFRVFTRESLKTINERMFEEETRQKLEQDQKKSGAKPAADEDDDGPQPNEKMEQGEVLPVRLSAAFEEHMAGVPMEDIDPYYKNIPTFVIITKKKEIFRFSATPAMGIMSPFNPVRRAAIGILTHWMFSLAIITTILTNCYVMIIPATPVTESTEVVFTAIYTFESAVKVMARGFILAKFTYLRDAWNWLDFVVISLAYVTMAIDLGNLAALRTCRVFRALKTVAIVPGLKTIVGAVIESVKNLRDVIILTVFALAVFGLIGLQIYMGVLTQKCVAVFPEDGSEGAERDMLWEMWNQNLTNWYPYPPPEEYGAADYPLCGNSSGAGTCPENYTCLQGYGPNPNYGYTSFDYFGWAFLASFRLMTQDFWESLYQQILRSAGPWHMMFFIVIIFLGSYYLVNLILAIVAMSYDELEKKAEEDRLADEAELEAMAREEEERETRKEARAQRRAAAKAAAAGDAFVAAASAAVAAAKNTGEDIDTTDDPLKSPSRYSNHSHETWTEGQTVDDCVKDENDTGYCTEIPVRKDSSVSLPGSPYRSCPRTQHHRRSDKLLVLSTYMDAQNHLPYADDSTAATPISVENGAILLPFCNGLHEGFPNPHTNNCFHHASYSSHLSRSTYNSHQNILLRCRHSCGFEQPLTKESQLIQRARNLQGGVSSDNIDSLQREYRGGSADESCSLKSSVEQNWNTSGRPGSGGVGEGAAADGVDLKDAIERSARLSDPESIWEGEEPPTLKQIIKAKIVELLFKALDIFCLWDCGFPWSTFKKVVAFIVFDAFMELTITLSTITCVAFMALDHYGLDKKVTMNAVLKSGNMLFTVIFTMECTMKVIAMSPKYFFQIGWNVFDFLIVVISLVEVVFEDANVPGLSALRSFRLLRVFKLAKSWPTLNMILNIMGQTVGSLTNLVIVLVIIIFIFAVMGMQLFAKDYFEKTHLFPGGDMPRWNFTDFGHSFMIIFRVLCGEWIESMWDCMLVSGGACVPFFLATVLIGNLVLLNLFLALLLSSFGGPSVGGDSEPNKLSEAFDRIGRFNAWVKSGIRAFFRAILDGIVRLKNRILRRTEVEPDPAVAAEAARRARRAKRPRLAKTARMLITTNQMMNAVKEQRAANEAAAAAAEEEGRAATAKSLENKKDPGAEDDLEAHRCGDEEEDEETYEMSEEDEEWSEDEDEDNMEGNDGELMQGEIVDDGPQDCMPPGFYEKFPVFDVDDTPFGVFWSNIRLKSFRLIENKYFETAVIVMILLSSLAMAFEDVHLPNNPILTDILFYLDRIFTVIFTFEMLLKWVAMGFVTFFSNAWCWLDFFIVMVSLINLIAALAGAGSVQAFKTLKTLRALRPLKAMAKMEGMRVVVNALVQSIPSITNVLMVCLIFWLIFAIMGVQLFNGKFHKCLDPEDGTRPDYRIIRNKLECLAMNFTWENSVMNFDHVGQAYLSLFQVATFKGWIGIMNDAIDSREIDEQPHREVSFAMYGFFVCFIIFGSFFTLNLFIGVIIDNFNEQQKKAGASLDSLMTEDQKKYYAAMQKMKAKKPIKAIPKPVWKPQLLVYNFVTNKKFDMVIMLFIGLNMGVMTCDHYHMSPEWDSTLGTINSVFVAVFTGESILKMFALRCHYFKEPWNLFDVVVVFMSVAGLMLSDLIEKYFVSPTLLRVVRVAKVGRVLRLVKGAKGIRTLLFSLAMSLPALFNICLLLFLIMFIFAIFGMSFFMNVKLRGALDDVYNFQTFAQSFILLFQMSTSAGWDGVLEGIRDEEDCEEPDPEIGKSGDCGNATVAIAFLLSYLVISFLIVINMYIAVILDNYSHATEEVQEGLTDDDYDMYYEIWAQFDPDGKQYIPYHQLSDFVDVLEPPLQIVKPNRIKLASMNITVCKNDMMHCVDILDALTIDFFARKGNQITVSDDVTVPTNRPGYEPVSSTLKKQREEYCALRIQRIWRDYKRKKPDSGTPARNCNSVPKTDK